MLLEKRRLFQYYQRIRKCVTCTTRYCAEWMFKEFKVSRKSKTVEALVDKGKETCQQIEQKVKCVTYISSWNIRWLVTRFQEKKRRSVIKWQETHKYDRQFFFLEKRLTKTLDSKWKETYFRLFTMNILFCCVPSCPTKRNLKYIQIFF